MNTYVLIHGGWHGGWCWDKVAPLLEKEGHAVVTPNLPGHGMDKESISGVTLAAYVDNVCEVLDAQSDAVILVGHSIGGAIISQAAEYRPQKIMKLVYLAAFLLQNGKAAWGLIKKDKDAFVLPNLIVSKDMTTCTLQEDALKEAFYGDCSDEDVARAKSLLVSQALAPFAAPLNITPENFGRIPRVYISCSRDRAISPSVQEKMYKDMPCEKVIIMDTSHSPFISAPEEVAAHLLSL